MQLNLKDVKQFSFGTLTPKPLILGTFFLAIKENYFISQKILKAVRMTTSNLMFKSTQNLQLKSQFENAILKSTDAMGITRLGIVSLILSISALSFKMSLLSSTR